MNRNCCRQSQISQRPSHPPNTFWRPERVEVQGLQRHTVCQKFARISEGLRNRNRVTLRSSGLSGSSADAINSV
jgi:hypothetical protein